MRKTHYQIYLVLGLAIFMLFALPKRFQNALRNQFLRPLITLGHLIPNKSKALVKKQPKVSIDEKEPFAPSYPGAALAKIIYRTPSAWNDFFWINLGKINNREAQTIAINSPVLLEGALIGLVDYVGEKQSRVQLITSNNLTISVRVLRGKDQYQDIQAHLQALLETDLIQKEPSAEKVLSKLKKQIEHESQNWYLAKGELSGTSEPLWRSKSQILIGKGFNCEERDAYGVQRDLLTGKSLDRLGMELPLVKPDDLLITTGLEGIFPEGLKVARVSEVEPLIEGAYYYALKAKPIAPNLNELKFVEVILPIDFKTEEVPLRAFAY